MPCYDGSNGPAEIRRTEIEPLINKIKKLEAMLCGIASIAEIEGWLNQVLNKVNWKEAGVNRAEFDAWWKLHQEEDRKRKLKEQQAARTKRITQDALNKLTDEEKKLLGLK